ncbi:MAG TPA: Rieske (2Fe-2S) protein [Nitrospirota bacterium]|nr:Rieske (2Fe-2S) protein [Nitrospirota bacterium]
MTTRREFLQRLLAALGLTALASFFYPLAKYFSPPAGESGAKQLVLSKKDIPVGDAKDIVFNGSPGIVVNRPDKGFVALSRVCTHLGCLVEFQKDRKRFLCPCHAGTYDLSGNVTSGPPPKPLPQIPLKVEGDSIIIG